MRTIYIDADACPVTHIAEEIARRHGIPVTILCDTNHVMYSDYSTVKLIGAGADAVDLALINLCKAGDIVITQDYGVAALAAWRRLRWARVRWLSTRAGNASRTTISADC